MELPSDTMSHIASMMPSSDLLIPGIRDYPGVKIIVRERVKEGEYYSHKMDMTTKKNFGGDHMEALDYVGFFDKE